MREIKFRAWDTVKKIMYSPEEMGADQEALLPDGRGFANISSVSVRLTQIHSHLLPLQYTGLKDKNGKEIYEGDIIRGFLTDNHPAIVEYEDAAFVLILPNDPDYRDMAGEDNNKSYKVIGSIHENPELLTSGVGA